MGVCATWAKGGRVLGVLDELLDGFDGIRPRQPEVRPQGFEDGERDGRGSGVALPASRGWVAVMGDRIPIPVGPESVERTCATEVSS